MKLSEDGGVEETVLSPPVWGAWVEIFIVKPFDFLATSPPVWGAWVEILV